MPITATTASTAADKTTSLEKGIRIIEYLAEVGTFVSLNSISKDLEISKPTLVRLLGTFKAHGFVSQDPDNKRYALGWALIGIGNAAYRSFDLPKLVRPYMEQLCAETGESCSLLLLRKGKVVNVDHVLTPNNILGGVRGPGTELSLHCSASGKLLLCSMTDEEITKYIEEMQFIQRTPNTITTSDALWKELHAIRQQGYSLDNEEYELGCRSLAVPIQTSSGKAVAAISITAPTARLSDEALPHFVNLIKTAAQKASMQLSSPIYI